MRIPIVYFAGAVSIGLATLVTGCLGDTALGYAAYHPSYAPIVRGPCYSYGPQWGTGPRVDLTTTRHAERYPSPRTVAAVGGGPHSGCRVP